MIKIEISYDEAEVLFQVLENRLEEMRDEIHHTDHREYRELLKAQKQALQNLLQRLEEHLRVRA